MPRYIDADLEVSDYVTVWDCDCSEFEKQTVMAVGDLQYLPTAEVVPKSEVERLQEALSKAEADVKNYMKVAEYQQNLSVKRYHEIKRLNEDVERLQEEIETFKDTNEHLAVLLEEAKQAYANYEETTGLKQAKQEVAREIFADLQGLLVMRIGVIQAIAELKKKYTEEKT